MRIIWQDIRYGVRVLLRNPAFTAVAIFVIALGIGANTAIFSVVNAVLLRPLPFDQPERLVKIFSVDTKRGNTSSSVSFPNLADFSTQNDTFEAMAAYSDRSAELSGGAGPERIGGLEASVDMLKVLAVQPALGRTFTSEDEQSAAPVIMLSYSMWQRRFGADQNIIGQQLTLNNQPKTIVGVLPATFSFPFSNEQLEFVVPLNPKGQREVQRSANFFEALGRLKPGVTPAQAESQLQTIAARLEEQYPQENDGQSASVISAHEDLVGNLRTTLLVLLGAVGFVLLIACANVANLQLARATRRGREMAIRVALGASRGRVVSQLLTENLLLSIFGGALGLLFALWGVELISSFVPADIPRFTEAGLDPTVLLFTLAASIMTGVFFGLAPALQASRTNLNEALKEGGRSSTDGRSRHRVRSLLIVSEVALSLVLLVGAGLLTKSFLRLRSTNPGFNSQNVLTAAISLPSARYPKDEMVARFYERAMESASRLPGVESVGAILPLPFSENSISTGFSIEGQPDGGPGARPIAGARIITPGYIKAMGIPLISGRTFDERDATDAPKTVLINEALARRFFPDGDAIGSRLALGINDFHGEIVGVVGNVRDHSLDKEAGSEFYLPSQQLPVSTMSIVVRTSTDNVTGIGGPLRSVVQELDRDLPLYRVRPMESLVSSTVARQRFSMTLIIAFAGLALGLAAVGIFSVMSFLVAQRTHEIGVRMALGAQPRAIVNLVVRHGAALTLIGVAAGLIVAFAVTRVMQSLLYEVSATDTATFIIVPLVVIGVALVASFVPARRATKVDPMVALRCE